MRVMRASASCADSAKAAATANANALFMEELLSCSAQHVADFGCFDMHCTSAGSRSGRCPSLRFLGDRFHVAVAALVAAVLFVVTKRFLPDASAQGAAGLHLPLSPG